MSVRVMSWVFEHADVESAGELLVLLVLADHAHDDGTSAYPSVDTIARKARMTPRAARRVLRRLEEAGAIKRTQASLGRRPSTYVVLMPNPDTSSGFNPDRGDTNPDRNDRQPGPVGPPNHQEPSEPSLSHPEREQEIDWAKVVGLKGMAA